MNKETMLRDTLEESVWAAVFAKNYDLRGCWKRAFEWAKSKGLPGAAHNPLTDKRAAFEMAGMTAHAIETADHAILNLREHTLRNIDQPRTPHVLGLDRYIFDDGELDFDIELESFEEVED